MKKKGQALVEFALIIPILLFLVIGVFDLYQLFFAKIVLNNAAREGAYFLSINPSDDSKCETAADPIYCFKGTVDAVLAEASNSGIVIDPHQVAPLQEGGSGDPVEVQVSHVINLSILDFFTGPVTLSSSTRMAQQ